MKNSDSKTSLEKGKRKSSIILKESRSTSANLKTSKSNVAHEEPRNSSSITKLDTKSTTYEKRTSKAKPRRIRSHGSEIPTRGSLLLEWVQRHMSFVEEEGSEESEEIIETEIAKQSVPKVDSDKTVKKTREARKSEPTSKMKKEPIPTVIEVPTLKRPSGLVDEIITIIKRRRQLAGLEPLEGKDVKKKSIPIAVPKKKKPTKKELQALVAQQTLEAEEAAKMAEEQRKDTEKKLIALNEKQELEALEQRLRVEQLTKAVDYVTSLKEFNIELEKQKFSDEQWKLYVDCGKLPIATDIANMNTYLHLWEQDTVGVAVEGASARTKDATKLIRVLEELIETKEPENPNDLQNWKWVKDNLVEHQKETMEAATYKILRNVANNMERIDLETADYNYKGELFILCLWLKVQLPIPIFNPRKAIPPPVKVNLKILDVQIEFPQQINCLMMALRCLYLKYDHYSDKCRSHKTTPKPGYYSQNLLESVEDEWKIRLKYKVLGKYRQYYEKELQRREAIMLENANRRAMGMVAPLDVPPMEKFKLPVIEDENNIPVVPAAMLDPSPSEYVNCAQEQKYTAMKKAMLYEPDEFEVNLRKYIVLGGVFNVNLYYQPPQPQTLVTMEATVTPFVLPKRLEEVPYYESYKPPRPSSTSIIKTPEEIESALKKQEEDLAKLILITLSLPKHVVFLEMPTVCIWDEKMTMWSTRDVHDVKPNEEKGTITFRTARFGCFGLASFKYSNLPFQTWELKPEEDGSITFSLTAAVIMFEFKIKGRDITVTQLQNSPNESLSDTMKKTYTLRKLGRVLQDAGIDIFPEHDAFSYIENSCEKHWPTAEMCYYNMAQISHCYNVTWSRWNATEGDRSLLFQMRPYKHRSATQKPYQMVLVTSRRAAFIRCSEVSAAFNGEPVEGSKFNSNLWNLMNATSTAAIRNKLKESSKETTYTLAQLLIRTRIFSFS